MVQFSRLLGGTVLLQLLVGCLAVGMLLLVRTEARRDELAMCVALGASRRRLAYGIACEAALTTIGGLLLAVPSTVVLFGWLRGVRLPGAIVLAQTARTVGLGLLAGLGLAWLGAGTIRSFLFHVQPLDPATLSAVALCILLLSLAASLRAALRAARVDLSTILKAE